AADFPLPSDVATLGDPAGEIVVADIEGFARAVWNGAEVIDQRLDPTAAEARAAQSESGYRVVVTARSYLRDVFLAVDRVDARATVDRGLVTLLAGESTTFHITSDAVVDPE